MRISDWSSDVCSSDLEPVRSGKILIRIEAAGVAARRGHFRACIGCPQGTRLVLGAIDAIGQIARPEGRNRPFDHPDIHLLELVRERTAETAMKIGEDGDGRARWITPDDRARGRQIREVYLLRDRKSTRLNSSH